MPADRPPLRPLPPSSVIDRSRRALLATAAGLGIASLSASMPAAAVGAEKFVFLTNWYAQAEHGGFYQALADGTYRDVGLDAEIRMGGPQVNVMQLLLAGKADAVMGYDFQTINAIEQGLPVVTVGAVFQKDPAALIAHPDVKRLEDLKTRTLLIGQASETTFWPWLKARYGFTDAQKRPYAFSVQPFLADPKIAQQGYATSEPWSIEKAGVRPVVLLLADAGYPPYAQTIVTTRAVLAKRRDALVRFLRATATGWKRYLADPAAGNALIRKANPEMEDALLAYGVDKMRQFALVTGGDASTVGILGMTDARWKQTFDFMAGAGLAKRDTDWKQAYTLDIVAAGKVLP
ncbi:MAG: ABC transporter substrate-binding protein [Burkholderiales bacterium]|jgi:NitT/TauT family transport system substrate-binding protein|nr:ABC transporter substrate-binding protein [Burkholderiales bacterium]